MPSLFCLWCWCTRLESRGHIQSWSTRSRRFSPKAAVSSDPGLPLHWDNLWRPFYSHLPWRETWQSCSLGARRLPAGIFTLLSGVFLSLPYSPFLFLVLFKSLAVKAEIIPGCCQHKINHFWILKSTLFLLLNKKQDICWFVFFWYLPLFSWFIRQGNLCSLCFWFRWKEHSVCPESHPACVFGSMNKPDHSSGRTLRHKSLAQEMRLHILLENSRTLWAYHEEIFELQPPFFCALDYSLEGKL